MSMSEYLTPEQQQQTSEGLDSWVQQQISDAEREFAAQHDPNLAGGRDPSVGGDGTGSQPPPASPPLPDPNQPPPAVEYQVGHVRVPEQDAPRVAQLYTWLRNNPDRVEELDEFLTGRQVRQPPPWQQPPTPPPYVPPTAQPGYVPPQTTTLPTPPLPGYAPTPLPQYIPPATPTGLDLEDPNIRYLYEQNRTLLAQQEAARRQFEEYQQQQRQLMEQERTEQAKRVRDQMVLDAVNTGAQRFMSKHPELDDAQFAQISSFVAQTNLVRGLSERMPYDQAVEEAMELATPRVLTARAPATKTAADAQRQGALTALSGSTGSPGTRSDGTPPPNPNNRLQRKEVSADDLMRDALAMIERTGTPLGSTI
jgi:hypothetical protein